jgi:hypothetical protein
MNLNPRKMKTKKIFSIVLIMFAFYLFTACGAAHTNVGLNMSFGPNGPYITPHVGVNFYGGGRY